MTTQNLAETTQFRKNNYFFDHTKIEEKITKINTQYIMFRNIHLKNEISSKTKCFTSVSTCLIF